MNYCWKQSGGIAYFPGRANEVRISDDELDEHSAAEIQKILHRVRFFELPKAVGGASKKGAADIRTHTLTIRDGGKTHTVTWDETSSSDLCKVLELLTDASRRMGRK